MPAGSASAPGSGLAVRSWAADLPKLQIRAEYLQLAVKNPTRGGGVRTGNWPVKVRHPGFDIPAFREHLEAETRQSENTRNESMRNLSRFFDMVEAPGFDFGKPDDAGNPAVLVALFTSNLHKKMFGLRIMSTDYTWTSKVIGSL